MSIVMVARQIQRLLVQWGSHSTIHLVSHRQFDGFLDVLESGIATLGLNLAELEGGKVDALQVIDVDGTIFKLGLFDTADGMNLQVEAKQLDSFLHDGCIACNQWAALLVSLFAVQGANGNLRTNTCWVAHRDG